MIRYANELTPTEKAAVETLLGRSVHEGEAVSVRTFEHTNLTTQQRLEISQRLKQYFAEVDAARKPVNPSEQEDAIAEAMKSVRPGYRSHQ